MRTCNTDPMLTFLLLTLFSALLFIGAVVARAQYRRCDLAADSALPQSLFVAAPPQAKDYSSLSTQELIAVAEERMRTDPYFINLREQERAAAEKRRLEKLAAKQQKAAQQPVQQVAQALQTPPENSPADDARFQNRAQPNTKPTSPVGQSQPVSQPSNPSNRSPRRHASSTSSTSSIPSPPPHPAFQPYAAPVSQVRKPSSLFSVAIFKAAAQRAAAILTKILYLPRALPQALGLFSIRWRAWGRSVISHAPPDGPPLDLPQSL
jgi:hypothetical protein